MQKKKKKKKWYQILYDGVQIRERVGRREPIKTLPYHHPLYLSLKFGHERHKSTIINL
jgi:hypothetical protein